MSLLGSKRSRTTAYHPQANGMVERFHRQLKAQPNPDSWMDTLPLVLLGLRTALKEDISATAAEMVYGTTLRLPGEFFTPSPTTSLPDPSDFVIQLKSHFQTIIRPHPPRIAQRNSNIPHNLSTATHVFVRHDGVRKPLQPPYDGPFPIISRTDKHFTIALNNRNDTISIDRLKPAHMDSENSQTPQNTPHQSQSQSQSQSQPSPSHNPPTPTRNTRSGRHVRFPAYLSHNV